MILTKIIRKSGLGSTAVNLAKPFIKSGSALPSPEEARAHLMALSPDPGNSCLCEKAGTAHGQFELDIIIPAYNVENYIARCIDSALSQETRHSFRLIIVDDGSKDSTGSIIDDYAKDPRILVVHQKNRGLSGARNTGIQLSDSEYLMFLDSDDTLAPGALEALMKLTQQGAAIAEGGYNIVDTTGKMLSKSGHKSGEVLPYRDLHGYAWAKVFHNSVFRRLHFPEAYWYEDSIMSQIIYHMVVKQGLSAFGTEHSVYNYTVNPIGISHQGRVKPKSIDSLWITLQLHKDRQQLGLETNAAYYDYILRMLVLSYRRAEAQNEDAKKAMFVLWKDFLDKEFSGFETENEKYKTLQQAVREGNFRLYAAACRLI